MQIFLVGGAVRDSLMGRSPNDRDYVVVGSNDQEMIDMGFQRVGADFSVYLHPETGAEYALARTEKSTGPGYKDFTTSTVGVTLEQDLKRRDLTINAIAKGVAAYSDVYDPFNGRADIANKILRHIDDAGFAEDPLRVLRVARFAAKFPEFTVAKETTALCKKMVDEGMLDHLTPERVGVEMIKALNCYRSTRFFLFLQMCGALKVVFPELHALVDVPAGPYIHHPEGDSFTHTMLVLQQASSNVSDLVKFCALTHDLGKGVTPKDILPHHYGHEAAGVPIVAALVKRLHLASKYEDYGRIVAKYHTHVHNVDRLNAKTIVKMANDINLQRFPLTPHILPEVSACDARGRGPFYQDLAYPQARKMQEALLAVSRIKARDVCTEDELQNVNVLKGKMYKAQIAAVQKVMAAT